jgi:hypothetical protein
MRGSLWAVRLSIIAVDLLIAAIIVLSILPLITGEVTVDLPEEGIGEPIFTDDVVTLSVPVDIHNGGYFDIQDLRLRFRISEGDQLLTEQASPASNVPAGQTEHLDLALVFDMNDIPEEKLQDLVFNRTLLDVEVGIEVGYSLGLVKASATAHQEMEWEPMISDLTVDTDNAQFTSNGTNVDVAVPYSFRASEIAEGNTLDLRAQLSNATAIIGTSSETIVVQQLNQGEFVFTVPQATATWLATHPEVLILSVDATFQGATLHMEQTMNWEA